MGLAWFCNQIYVLMYIYVYILLSRTAGHDMEELDSHTIEGRPIAATSALIRVPGCMMDRIPHPWVAKE